MEGKREDTTLIDLADELLLQIFFYLTSRSLGMTTLVCRRFYRLGNDPSLFSKWWWQVEPVTKRLGNDYSQFPEDLSFILDVKGEKVFLVTASRGSIDYWDVKGGVVKRFFHSDYLFKYITSYQDKGFVFIVASNQVMKVWNTTTKEFVKELVSPVPCTTTCLISYCNKEAKFIISGSKEGTLYFWDVTTWECIDQLKVNNEILSLKIINNILVVNATDGTLQSWDLTTRKNLQTFKTYAFCKDFAVTQWKKTAILVAFDAELGKSINVWDLLTGELRKQFNFTEAFSYIVGIVCDGEDSQLILGNKRAIYIWDFESERLLKKLPSSILFSHPMNLLRKNTGETTIAAYQRSSLPPSSSNLSILTWTFIPPASEIPLVASVKCEESDEEKYSKQSDDFLLGENPSTTWNSNRRRRYQPIPQPDSDNEECGCKARCVVQ